MNKPLLIFFVVFGILLSCVASVEIIRRYPAVNHSVAKNNLAKSSFSTSTPPPMSSADVKVASGPTLPFVPTDTPRPPTVTSTPIPSPTKTPIAATPLKTHVKLMPLGDSITFGSLAVGGYRTELWKWLVQGDGDKIDFVGSLSSGPADLGDLNHEGHIGWTIPQLDVYAFNWMRLYQPDIVLLHIGSNDIDQGVSASVMTQSLIKLLADIYAGKSDTYVVVSSLIPTTRGDQGAWQSFNASIPGVAAQYRSQGYKIIALDMSQALTVNELADGLHPNSIGNSRMASTWYPVVSTIYKEYMANR